MRRVGETLHRFELESLDWEKKIPQCSKKLQECGWHPFVKGFKYITLRSQSDSL